MRLLITDLYLLRAVRYNSVEIVATGYCSNNHHLVLEGIGKKSCLPKDIKRKARACGISITSDTALWKQRAFTNVFSTPFIPQSWGTFESGGYPQTPSKGVLPLCTPQLLNDLKKVLAEPAWVRYNSTHWAILILEQFRRHATGNAAEIREFGPLLDLRTRHC